MKEREKKREQSFFPLLIVLSLGYLSTIVSSSSLEAARLTHFDTCIGHFDACLLMICDKQVRRVDPAWRERHRMLIASRNVNRRSIVNLYCNLDTSRKKKRKTERESKKQRARFLSPRRSYPASPRARVYNSTGGSRRVITRE